MCDYHMYIDESYDNKAPYIALVGIIIRSDEWKRVNVELDNLRKEKFNDETFNFKSIRRKNYDKKMIWKNLPEPEKRDFESKLDNVLKDKVTVIAALIDKDKMNSKKKEFLFNLAYSFLIERFEYFLEDFQDCFGTVMMDQASESPEVQTLKELHKEILKEGVIVEKGGVRKIAGKTKTLTIDPEMVKYKEVERVVENLTFQKDDESNFLQVADLIASAFSFEYNRKISKFSSRYRPLLRKSDIGVVEGYGLKEFPIE